MVPFKKFKDEVERRFISFIPAEYVDSKVLFLPVDDHLRVIDGLCLWIERLKMAPIVFIEDMYKEYHTIGDIDETLKRTAASMVECFQTLSCDSTKEFTVENLIFSLVNTEWNKEMLEGIPHREFLDLSVIYKVLVKKDTRCYTVLLTNDLMKIFGLDISEEELFDAAMKNTRRLLPISIESFRDSYLEKRGLRMVPQAVFDEDKDLDFNNFYACLEITTEQNFNGAVALIYEDILLRIANKIGSYYLLPSSTEEILIYVGKGIIPQNLNKKVKDINWYMDKKIRLSDHVYFFNHEKGCVEPTYKKLDLI